MYDWLTQTDDQIAKYGDKQHDSLVAKRLPLEDLVTLLIKIFYPRRYDMIGTEEEGRQFGAEIFNPQPAIARSKFSRGMIGNMVNKGDDDPWWVDFTVAKQWLMDVDDVKKFFQECQEQIKFGFNQSDFYREDQPFMDDAATNLCGVMIPSYDVGRDRTHFQTIHPKDNFIAQDEFGEVNVYSRPLILEAQVAYEKFGPLNQYGQPNEHAIADSLPGQLIKDAEGKNPFAEYEFRHVMMANSNADDNKVGSEFLPWVQFFICKVGGITLVEKSGHETGPIVLRLGRQSGQTYGTPPCADALTAALMGNKLSEKLIEAAHIAIENRWIASQSLEGQINLDAKGITYVEDMQEEQIRALVDHATNWPISDAQMDKFDDAVDEVLLVHFFEMLTSLRVRQPQKTAFEVNQMIQEKFPQLIPAIEAVEQDLLQKATDYIWAIQAKNGLMPDTPQILLDELPEPRNIINKYTGPLGVLRRTSRQLKGIATQMQMLTALTEIWPSAALRVKSADYTEHALITAGMKQKYVTEDAEFEEIQTAIAQQNAQDRELDIAERMSKILPAAGKEIEKGSLIGAET